MKERLECAIQRAKVKTVFDEKGKAHVCSEALLEGAVKNKKYLYTNLNALGSAQNKAAYEAYVDGINVEDDSKAPVFTTPAPPTLLPEDKSKDDKIPDILKGKTKKELVKFAKDELGVELSERSGKDDLIGEIVSHLE